MTNWATLEHAYGTAEDVPALLKAVDGPDAAEAWDELWSCLYHQGTVYAASYAALPALLDIATRRPPADRHNPLVLAGAIIASNDAPKHVSVDDMRRQYRAELTAFEALTRQTLEAPELRDDSADFVYLLQALLAFEAEPVWPSYLDGLANDVYDLACPDCDEYLTLYVGSGDFYTIVQDDERDDDAVRLSLTPAAPESLTGIAARLHHFAEDHGQPEVAHQLTYLFGRAICPACRTEFSVPDAVTAEDQ